MEAASGFFLPLHCILLHVTSFVVLVLAIEAFERKYSTSVQLSSSEGEM